MSPEPFYCEDGITIYCGDCRTILPSLGKFDLLLTDPPYGISADKGMAKNNGQWGFRNYGKTDWDASPCDEAVIVLMRQAAQYQVIWGGNYFLLPPSSCWLVWNKMQRNFDFADAEMAWTNLKKAVRVFDFSRGQLLQDGKVHPTQKPLSLMTWCLGQVPEAQTVLDPFMGSGTTLVAAKLKGLRATGIEINEEYCEIAVRRLAQRILIPA